jgi:lysophospholipase L1-like esterase
MRGTIVLFIAALTIGWSPAPAQVTRFLVVGDSWAEEQWLDSSHARVFADSGLTAVGVSGELTTTSGSTAAEWVMPVQLERIGTALSQYPHVDTVQLTIGGNDFLDAWNTGFSEAQLDELTGWIRQDVEFVATYILNQRPDIEIIISLYDYPNFEDTRNSLIWLGFCGDLWNDLGEPLPLEVNTAAVEVVDAVETLAEDNPRIRHVRHLGQAQNFFGLPGSPPGTLPPPGEVAAPSPVDAMRIRPVFGLDCFHFNATAYDVLIGNLVDEFAEARFAEGLVMTFDTAQVDYNGQPQSAPVSTVPAGQTLIVSYDGELDPPVDAGTYSVIATAPGWRESLSGTFEILPAAQSIDFSVPARVLVEQSPITLKASADSALPVSFALLDGPAKLDGNVLTLTGATGAVVIVASQSGNGNWQPAKSIERRIDVVDGEVFRDRFEAPLRRSE